MEHSSYRYTLGHRPDSQFACLSFSRKTPDYLFSAFYTQRKDYVEKECVYERHWQVPEDFCVQEGFDYERQVQVLGILCIYFTIAAACSRFCSGVAAKGILPAVEGFRLSTFSKATTRTGADFLEPKTCLRLWVGHGNRYFTSMKDSNSSIALIT